MAVHHLFIIKLDCRTITLRKDRFDEREDDFYEALYTQSQAQFATYVSTGTVVNNYAHIFDLLIRLRQVSLLCDDCSQSCGVLYMEPTRVQGLGSQVYTLWSEGQVRHSMAARSHH